MSELITVRSNREIIHRHLLVTVSALTLCICIGSADWAKAEEGHEPQVWIELGGQLESVQGTTSPFTAPFTSLSPTPAFYDPGLFIEKQKGAHFAHSLDGKLTFQPHNSDWIFSAGIRYGRSHASRHSHDQTSGIPANLYSKYGDVYGSTQLTKAVALQDTTTTYRESHMVLDFSAGRDVGIGVLGHDGRSTLNGGVRLLELSQDSTATIYARPQVTAQYLPPKYAFPEPEFNEYTLVGHARRSFRGIGPALSWNASAALIGNREAGELMLDWGVNASLLFGKQKATIDDSTLASHYSSAAYQGPAYTPRNVHSVRSRNVTIPNLGGFAGLSVKYPTVKVSLGYRADFFFGAVDAGIDTRHTKDLGFQGPYASVSIGLGD